LLWAPCAGPILGLVLTGAALHGADVGTFALLLAYALGAATSLALALLVGGRLFAAMKRSLGADTGWLARVSTASTNRIEQSLVEKIGAAGAKKDQTIESTIAPKPTATA